MGAASSPLTIPELLDCPLRARRPRLTTDPGPTGPELPPSYVWASAARLEKPELFAAVHHWYWHGVRHGLVDPPCNPSAANVRKTWMGH